MAIIDFPTNPSLNDIYNFDGKTWIWNGYAWDITGLSGISGPQGLSGYSGINGSNGTSGYSGFSGYSGAAGSPGATWSVSINNQSVTSYTLSISDYGKVLTFDNSSPVLVTVPIDLPIGFACEIIQIGAGLVTVSPAGGVSLNSFQARVSLAGQYAAATLVSYNTNTFIFTGNII